jgi:CheY-like chemotaxis protein
MRRTVLAAVSDLFFVAKLQAAARQVDVELVLAANAEELQAKARNGADLVVLDLNDRGLDALAAIGGLRSEPATAGIPLLGFLSHVETELTREAQAAGCDRVLPRSQFSARLPQLLAGDATDGR